MIRPRLGQHFLRDPRVVETILQAAELVPTDSVLEIGPGKGILTQPLVSRVGALVAVELDQTLAPKLQTRFAGYPHVRIIEGDFLKVNLDELFPPTASPPTPLPQGEGSKVPLDPHMLESLSHRERVPPRLVAGGEAIKVLGNLPYSITAPIFEKILAWPGWTTGVFLVQHEVGERMRSQPGSKAFGILSLAVQLFAEVEAIAHVKPGAFTPPPRVTSVIVRLRRHNARVLPEAEIPAFFDLVHAAFSHRRKTLANSLSLFADLPKKNVDAWLQAHGLRATARAETVELADYARLASPWAIFRREKN